MRRFFSGFFTGFFTSLLCIAIVVAVFVLGVPVSTYADWFGVKLEKDNPNANNSLLEFSKEVLNTVNNIEATSLNDIKTNFGFDAMALIKSKLGLAPDDTTLDNIAGCPMGQIGVEVQNLKVDSILTIAKVNLDANIKDMLKPVLNSTIKEASTSKTLVSDMVNGIKVKHLKAIKNTDGTSILPDLPLFDTSLDSTKPVVEQVGEKVLISIVKNFSEISIDQIVRENENTPKLLKSLIKNKAKLSDIPNVVMTKLPLGDIIDVNAPGNEIFKGLENTLIKDLPADIQKIKLAEIMKIDSNDPAHKDNILVKLKVEVIENGIPVNYSLVDRPIGLIGKEIPTAINNAKLGSFIDTTSSKLLTALADTKITQLGSAVNNLTLEQIINIDSNSPALLQALKGTNINNLQTVVQGLTIKDIIGTIDSTQLPGNLVTTDGKAFADWKITEVTANMNNAVKNVDISTLFEIKEGTFLDKIVKASAPEKVTLVNMDKMMQEVIKVATMKELNAWGMVDLTVEQLNKKIIIQKEPTVVTKTVGECSINDLINAMEILASSL